MDISAMGVFTIKINLDEAFLPEDKERADYKGAWVELREPTADETMKSQSDSAYLMKLIPKLIIDHNIDAGDSKATNDQVAAAIKQSSTVYTHVAQTWGEALPLARKNPEISETPLE